MVLTVMVPANNVLTVYVLSRFAGTAPAPLSQALGNMVRNPLIVATIAGALLNLMNVRLPDPLIATLNLLSQATLATGLLCVGAAVDLKGLKTSRAVLLAGSATRLIVAPAVMWFASVALGVPAIPLAVGVICLAAPLTTSAYILARQLGGDAVLAANLVSVTTLLSLATYPVVIFLVT